jgi:hypothetical protein
MSFGPKMPFSDQSMNRIITPPNNPHPIFNSKAYRGAVVHHDADVGSWLQGGADAH